MNRLLLFTLTLFFSLSVRGQITVNKAVVPKYMQGRSGTNNNRLPFAFWVEIKGLTAGATYQYYNLFDTIGGSSSKGSGGVYFVNKISGNIRRASTTSFTNPDSYDSLVADSKGEYSGWFMNESNGNARFTPGNIVVPEIHLEEKGSKEEEKIVLDNYPIHVIDFGKDKENLFQGSALWDSTNAPAKSMVFLYSNTEGNDRPIASSIVEDAGLHLTNVSSIETFYRNAVDGRNGRWGLIIPNKLPEGIRRVEYHDFNSGDILNSITNQNGIWCGLHTENPVNGTTAVFLNSLADISISMDISADTVMQNEIVNFTAISDSKLKSFTWKFGDNTSSKLENPSHQYTSEGIYIVTLTASDGDCEKVVTDTILVQLITSTFAQSEKSEINVYPNPGSGWVNLNTSISGLKEVGLFSIVGTNVFSYLTDQNNFSFDLTHLEKGIYFLQIKNEFGKVFSQKLVIN